MTHQEKALQFVLLSLDRENTMDMYYSTGIERLEFEGFDYNIIEKIKEGLKNGGYKEYEINHCFRILETRGFIVSNELTGKGLKFLDLGGYEMPLFKKLKFWYADEKNYLWVTAVIVSVVSLLVSVMATCSKK